MKVFFCPECGTQSIGIATICEECQTRIPDDSWADVSDEEIHQIDYVEDFDIPDGLPSWEYEVIRLKSDEDEGGLIYTSQLLNRMGDKGWELVNIVPLGDKDGPRYGVFKRAWLEDFEE